MISGEVLCKTDFTMKSVKDSVIKDAVSFLLNRDNITTVSWGNIDCALSEEETVVLPLITGMLHVKFNGIDIAKPT